MRLAASPSRMDSKASALWLPVNENHSGNASASISAPTSLPLPVPVTTTREELESDVTKAIRDEFARENLFLLVPVLFGAGAAIWFSWASGPPASVYIVAPVLCVAAALSHQLGQRIPSLFLFAIGLLFAGMNSAAFETYRQGTVILDSPVTTMLEGVVERREATGEARWRYVVAVKSTASPALSRPPERVALTVRTKGTPFRMGEVIRGKVRLSPPSGPALPGASDFGFSSYFDGIGATGFFYGRPERMDETAALRGWGTQVLNSLYQLRSVVGDRIRHLVPGDEGAFAAAIVTDERRAISWDVQEALRLAGLAHIVAISGLNMALAAGIFFIGARSVLAFIPAISLGLPAKKIAAAGAIVMVTAYYLISGFGVSAERAYIMMVIMLLAVLFDRPSISLHNIALSALLILMLHPSSVMGASFQMSFGATAALVAGYNFWAARQKKREDEQFKPQGKFLNAASFVWRIIIGTAVTSMIGGVSTAIFSISHFNQLSAYGLVANVATMPLISMVVMPAALVGMLSMPFGLDAPFFDVMGWGLRLVIVVAQEVASWNGDVGTGRGPPGFLPLAASGLILLVCLTSRLRLVGIILLGAAIIWFQISQRPAQPDLVISEDGRLVGLLEGRTAHVNRSRPPEFIFKQWQKALRFDDVSPPLVQSLNKESADGSANDIQKTSNFSRNGKREKLSATELKAIEERIDQGMAGIAPNSFFCIKTMICLANAQNRIRLAVLEDPRLIGYACDNASLIVAAVSALTICRSGTPVISGSALRKSGAVEISFNSSNARKDWSATSAFASTQRPWQQHRRYEWRSRSFSGETAQPLLRFNDSGE